MLKTTGSGFVAFQEFSDVMEDEYSACPPAHPPAAADAAARVVPVEATPLAVARPAAIPSAAAPAGGMPMLAPGGTDALAIASAVCGMTAIVPVLSQVLGLALGIAGLVRIRRARRGGVWLRGTGWAWTGIACSGFLLLSWIAVLAALSLVQSSLSHTTDALHVIAPAGG
jgi:hypothetical protein